MHGLIDHHAPLCVFLSSLGIGFTFPDWVPEWVCPCMTTELWKDFESTAAAIEGRRRLLASFAEKRLRHIDIHIEPEGGCK